MTAISIVMSYHNRVYVLTLVATAYGNQDTQEPLELIAIDDGSTDSTHETLTSFGL